MSTDEDFGRLVDLLRDTPRPDPAVRAAHLARAGESFAQTYAASQESRPPVRHSTGRRSGRRARGVFVPRPYSPVRRNAVLFASTALVACTILVVSPVGRDLLGRYATPAPTSQPAAEPVATTPLPATVVARAPAADTEPGPAAARPNASIAAPLGQDRRTPEPEAAGAVGRRDVTVDAQGQSAQEGLVENRVAPPPPAEPAQVLADVLTAAPAAEAMPGAAVPMPRPAPPPMPSARMAQTAARMAQQQQSYDAAAIASVAPPADWQAPARPDTEAYANAAENPVHVTAEDPVSTFSIDVDTAAWSVVRQSLSAGQLPPPDAVRVEEMINYFPYDYPAPAAGEAFRADVDVFPTPWNPATLTARIGIQGARPAIAERPPLDLVFLVDTSGSMQDANKLPLLVASLKLMLPELRAEDEVAIVTYAGSAGVALPPTKAGERDKIVAALDALAAGGSTNGEGGLSAAYATAKAMRGPGEVARVVLATDGDFNVGLSETDALTDYIARQRESGIDLSVLGFGRGNLDDATMQALAQNGNGQAAYIDTLSEARKVLVDQLAGTLFTIAKDVKIQVEWNPAKVAEWRLVGYETRALARTDFANDKVDAGELGAGTAVTALYELTPAGSPARLTEPLRYGEAARQAARADATEPAAGSADELGFLRLRWKAPGASESRLAETPIMSGTGEADADARFAAAVAGMGQLLRRSTHLGGWGWADAIALAEGARGADPFGYRAEAIRLMRIAEGLSR